MGARVRASCVKEYPGKTPSFSEPVHTHQKQHRSTHHATTSTTQTFLIMSQYNAAPLSAADNAGWNDLDPELAPFLPMTDQSGGLNTPAHAGAGQSVGSEVALPPNTGFMSFTG